MEAELEDLDECVDRETVLDIIHEIVLSLIGKKGQKGCKVRLPAVKVATVVIIVAT